MHLEQEVSITNILITQYNMHSNLCKTGNITFKWTIKSLKLVIFHLSFADLAHSLLTQWNFIHCNYELPIRSETNCFLTFLNTVWWLHFFDSLLPPALKVKQISNMRHPVQTKVVIFYYSRAFIMIWDCSCVKQSCGVSQLSGCVIRLANFSKQ